MESNFDPTEYKSKFGVLISRLHEIGFTDDIITKRIVEERFFSCFEDNKQDVFLKTPLEEIIQNVFDKENVVFDYGAPYVSEYYWAGEAYFTLLMDGKIPLERLFLICPLSKMVQMFSPYHEMPFSSLKDAYVRDEKEKSIFKSLKQLRHLTNKELSVLTGIKVPTLNSYKNNDILYRASFQNLTLLSKAFHISPNVFKKETSFFLISDDLLHDETFLIKFKKKLVSFFGIEESTPLINKYQSDKELLALGKKYKRFLYLPDFALIKYQRKLAYRFLRDEEIYLLAKDCIDN